MNVKQFVAKQPFLSALGYLKKSLELRESRRIKGAEFFANRDLSKESPRQPQLNNANILNCHNLNKKYRKIDFSKSIFTYESRGTFD